MTEPAASNPTGRALAIIELLANADHPLGLSDIARQSGLAKATCLAIVRAASEAGWVAQDEATRRYSIGSALVWATASVRRRFGDWGPATEVLAELGEGLGSVCSVLLPLHDELITVATADDPDPVSQFVPIGHRVVFQPPFGAAAVLRSSSTAFDHWLARAEPPLGDEAEQALRKVMRAAVRQGWIASSMAGASRRARARLADLHRARSATAYLQASGALAVELLCGPYLLGPRGAREVGPVSSISVPVRLAGAGPHPILYADLRGDERSGRQLATAGTALVAAAERLATTCRPPDPRAR